MSEKILEAASALAAELTDDIRHARNREDHIRVTARANAAAHLLQMLETVTGNGGTATDTEQN